MAIKSFKNKMTAELYEGIFPKKGFPQDLVKSARRRLGMLDAAIILNDLRSPSGNKLHELYGVRKGQHAIRINDQFRICFFWTELGAENVEITDYH
jgi:toxin HigB-1